MSHYIKRDVIEQVTIRTGLKFNYVERVVNALFIALREMMERANPNCRIEIRNFGVFEVKPTRERNNARNPRQPTQEYTIPPHRKVLFRPGGELKRELHRPLSSLSQPKVGKNKAR